LHFKVYLILLFLLFVFFILVIFFVIKIKRLFKNILNLTGPQTFEQKCTLQLLELQEMTYLLMVELGCHFPESSSVHCA